MAIKSDEPARSAATDRNTTDSSRPTSELDLTRVAIRSSRHRLVPAETSHQEEPSMGLIRKTLSVGTRMSRVPWNLGGGPGVGQAAS